MLAWSFTPIAKVGIPDPKLAPMGYLSLKMKRSEA